MTLTEILSSRKRLIRLAGFIYLLLVLSGIFSLLFVPGKLFDWANPALTISNIENSLALFQWGIVASLFYNTCFIFLPLVLYKLLQHIDRNAATVMVIFTLLSVAITFLNETNHYAVLNLLSGQAYLSHLSPVEIQTQVMFYLDQHGSGLLIAHIFWGLWLFPFGYLVYKSGFLPKFFGIMLMIGCFGYLIDFVGYSFFSGYGKSLLSTLVGIPSAIGEIGICLWMLIAPLRNMEQ